LSDAVDHNLLFDMVRGTDREVRLLRLQIDSIVPRLAAVEQSFHDLASETARGFGQLQQQMSRQEKRLDVLDEGLAALRTEVADGTARIIQAISSRT